MKPSNDDSFRFLAARYFREQAKCLATELVGVRAADDVERVHQARVASRRLRAALVVFRTLLPEKTAKQWRKAIRRVTSGLGTARDCDVHIEELSAMLLDLNANKGKRSRRKRSAAQATAQILVEQQNRREACQPDVLREIDRLEQDGVLEEILHMAKETLVDAEDSTSGPFSPEVYRGAGKQISEKYKQLKSLEGCLKSSKDRVRHHEMRIAAKRLRYTMEILRPVYGTRLDKSIADVKRLQEILGDIHDCDLWCVHLGKFARSRRKQIKKAYGTARPFDEMKRGYDYLSRRCKERRRQRFADLVNFWAKLKRKGRWKKLLKIVRSATKTDARENVKKIGQQKWRTPDGCGHRHRSQFHSHGGCRSYAQR